MATVKEVRAVWTVAKAAVGGVKEVRDRWTNPGDYGRGVRILPECVEVFAGSGECVRASIALGIGPVVLDADNFAALVKLGSPSDPVAVEVTDTGIRWNGADAPIKNKVELPDGGPTDGDWYGPYPGAVVKGAAGFASSDWVRPVLQAVAFRNNEVVATDSYRMSREKVRGGRLPGDDPVVIPARALAAIGGKADTVMVAANDSEAKVLGDIPVGRGKPTVQVEWSGAAIQGQYPKYEDIWPEEWGVEVGFYPEPVERVKDAAAVERKNKPAALTLNGTMDISFDSQDGITLPPTTVGGPVRWSGDAPVEPMRIGVNAGFLRDAVKYLDDGGCVIYRAISPERPMMLERGPMNGRGQRQVLIMPIRLGA